MSRVVRYGLLIGLGVLVGLGLLWLSGNLFTSANSAKVPVAPGGPSTSNNSPNATPAPAITPVITPTTLPTAPPPPPPAAIGTEYLALGDSVAYGIGAPDSVNGGYAGIFYANYLKRVQPNLQLYRNLAIPGETSSSFLTPGRNKSQLQRTLEELDAAAKAGRRVSPVTLTLGGNDLLNMQGKSNAEREAILATFDTDYNQILDELKTRLNGADLIVTTYYNPNGPGADTSETTWLQRLNEAIKKDGAAYGAKLADFYGPIVGQEKSLTWAGVGDVHPTQAGHAVLAQALWRATGYDRQPPTLALTYSPLQAGKAPPNSRLVFQLSTQDEWWRATTDPGVGAGRVVTATVSLDKAGPVVLTSVPTRYDRQAAVQEYGYILDTSSLAAGLHSLRFEAGDAAGNIGSVEITFEVG